MAATTAVAFMAPVAAPANRAAALAGSAKSSYGYGIMVKPAGKLVVAPAVASRAALHGGLVKGALKSSRVKLSTSFIDGEETRFDQLRLQATVSLHGEAPLAAGQRGGVLGAQMNIFTRVARIFNAFVGGFVSSQEDPEKLLDQAAEEMGADLAKLRQTAAQVVASKRMLENKYNQAQNASNEWYARARRALEVGDELLAKEALKRRKAFEDSSRSLGKQLEQQSSVADRILSSSRALEGKIQEARSKKDNLKARAQSAKTSKQIQEMLGSIDTTSALAAFERMEEKVMRLESESDALAQIATDDLSTQFALLEAEDVGDDLAQLKKEMGANKIRGELPSGQVPSWMQGDREKERIPDKSSLFY